MGAGSQFDSFGLPGESFCMYERERAVRILLQPRQHRRVDQVPVERVLAEQLALAVIHRYRPERIHRRELTRRESDRVIVLAGVERLAVRICAAKWVHGLSGIVAIQSTFGRRRPLQPIALVEVAVAEHRTHAPAIDVLHAARQVLVNLVVALFHSQQYRGLVLRRQLLEIERLARSDANRGELGANGLVILRRRARTATRHRGTRSSFP